MTDGDIADKAPSLPAAPDAGAVAAGQPPADADPAAGQALADLEPAAGQAPTDPEPAERAHPLQRSMAGAATFLAAIGAVWGLHSPVGAVLLFPFIAIAWTLFVRELKGFRALCHGVGAVVTVFGLLLACIGVFVMIPSSLILLMAAAADPRRRPVLARVWAGVTATVVIGALTAVTPLAYDAWLRPSYAYSVEIAGGAYGMGGPGSGVSSWDGVTGVSESGLDSGTRLVVTYDKALTEAERTALRDALAAMPGAGPVEACGRGGCD